MSLILLTLIYALALNSFKPWDLLMGVVISGGLLWLFRRFLFGRRRIKGKHSRAAMSTPRKLRASGTPRSSMRSPMTAIL